MKEGFENVPRGVTVTSVLEELWPPTHKGLDNDCIVLGCCIITLHQRACLHSHPHTHTCALVQNNKNIHSSQCHKTHTYKKKAATMGRNPTKHGFGYTLSVTLSQKKRYDWLNSNSSTLNFFMKGSRMTLRHEKIQHLPINGEKKQKKQDRYIRIWILIRTRQHPKAV